MNIVSYIIINLFLFTSWYTFFFRYKELLSFVDRIISTFILGLTQIIVTEMLLGVVFKKLYAVQLLLINIFLSSVVLIYVVSACRKQSESSCRNYIRSLVANIFKEISDKAVWFGTVIKNDLILLLIFILFSISVCWIIFLGYLFPSYTWDALWYHLPIAGYLLQNGAICEVPNNSFIEQFINIFPKNIELLFIWNIIFLENDIVTDLSQLFFTITGVLTIYSIAVKLKINKKYAIYSSLLFFFTPIIVLQSSTNYVDVAVSVLFLMAINFLMSDNIVSPPLNFPLGKGGHRGVKRDMWGFAPVLLSGLTAGILLGSKGSGPLFVGILSAAVIIREFIWRSKSSEPEKVTAIKIAIKSFSFYLIFFFIPAFLMGGYWYIKNWMIYGNPVYPMEISFLNSTIFKGLYQGIIEPAPEVINKLNAVTRPLYVWLENVEYYLYDSRLGGLGPVWFILFLPSIVFSFVYALIKRNYRFIALLIIFTAAFLMHPRNWNPRYVIFIVGLGALSFGLVSDYFQERKNAIRIIAFLLAGYTFLISNSPCVTPKQIKKFMQLSVNERTIAVHAPFNIDLHARQEYGYWMWISRNISRGETLAYTFEPLFLSPLWNSAFSNKIVYIKDDKGDKWLKMLKEKDVTYLLIRKNSIEDKWIGSEKGKYRTVFSDENYKIAKVMQNEY
ncbi:MAG: hypothetical protein HZB30_11240 [Nitrospirae bacterium]|nr:hypothetical protein [Nitrospirota bacterium]